MRAWLEERGSLGAEPALADDLVALTYGFDHANRLKLEAKKDLKARGLPSPDLADALALTFAYPVAPADLRTGGDWARAAPEISPFAGL